MVATSGQGPPAHCAAEGTPLASGRRPPGLPAAASVAAVAACRLAPERWWRRSEAHDSGQSPSAKDAGGGESWDVLTN